MTDQYADAVEARAEQIARLSALGGNLPAGIVGKMAEKQADTTGWARLLDAHPMTPEQQGMIDTIVTDSALLWEAIERLKATYGET